MESRIDWARRIERECEEYVNAFGHETDLTIDDFAVSVNLSTRQVQRALKMADTRWKQIVIAHRTAAARDLMIHSDYDLQRVAVEVGYLDQRTMVRNYKLRYDETPLKTRRDARGVR